MIKDNLEWQYEGKKYVVYETQKDVKAVPVYRFFNTENGAHLYTDSEIEKNRVNSLPKFSFEGTKYFVL